MSAYRVLITRPDEQHDDLAARLLELGLEPVEVPAIAIAPPASYDDLDRAIAGLDRFDWIVVTSRNAVAAFFARLAVVAPGRTLPRRRWASIGPATAQALRVHGIDDVWTPTRYVSEAVGEEMPAVRGERVLRLRAETASDVPARVLRERGVDVVEVVAYRTIEAPPASRPRLAQALREGVDAVIFTSASTVRGLTRLAAEVQQAQALRSPLLVAIGPVTAGALEEAGLHADVVAGVHTIDGIVSALSERRTARAGFESR